MTSTALPAKFVKHVNDDVEWTERQMGHARTKLVELASVETNLADRLYDATLAIGKYEAHLQLAYQIQRYASHETATVENIREVLLDVALPGPQHREGIREPGAPAGPAGDERDRFAGGPRTIGACASP